MAAAAESAQVHVDCVAHPERYPEPAETLLQQYKWVDKHGTWVCKVCLDQAARVVGSPVMEYRGREADRCPSAAQLRDMAVHQTYHQLGGDPPQYQGFTMHRERQMHGDAFMYACHQCNWKVGVNVAFYDRCHSGLAELTRRTEEHRQQHRVLAAKPPSIQ